MPPATVRIPSLLAEIGDGRKEIPVEASTVGEALEGLFRVLPQLRVHVFDETGSVRPNVSVFHDGRAARDAERLAAPIEPGAVVTILQAVSGGASRIGGLGRADSGNGHGE
ncbi:MAG TPA: MoaD/ThiS family protein [Acidimicrobiia bacterium]|nr:MoaD/ThiS family protein [Acidimicrobiia bacterium]